LAKWIFSDIALFHVGFLAGLILLLVMVEFIAGKRMVSKLNRVSRLTWCIEEVQTEFIFEDNHGHNSESDSESHGRRVRLSFVR
jgi:hypothetical protein